MLISLPACEFDLVRSELMPDCLVVQDETRIGRPLVPDARVIAAVEVLLRGTWHPRKCL